MARQELNTATMTTEQLPPIVDHETYDGDIIIADPSIAAKEYLEELAFMEEAVTIRLQPSSDRNAAMAYPVTCNGKPAEVFQRGRWEEIGYLPVAQTLIVKRKVLEIIIRAKVDTVNTLILNQESEHPQNEVTRFTKPVHSVTIIEDRNPRGSAWCTEQMRRNY